jgi:hypothetical protein
MDFHKLWMLEKMEFEENIVEHSLTLLGGGKSLTIQRPKEKGRNKPSDAQKKEKILEKHAHKRG